MADQKSRGGKKQANEKQDQGKKHQGNVINQGQAGTIPQQGREGNPPSTQR
jgi:hypothetical protein